MEASKKDCRSAGELNESWAIVSVNRKGKLYWIPSMHLSWSQLVCYRNWKIEA